MKIVSFTTMQKWVHAAAEEIFHGQPKNIALSGGNTPIPIFQEISRRGFATKKTNIFLTDERFVSFNHTDSNAQLIKKYLDTPASFHFWNTQKEKEKAAEEYAQKLKGIVLNVAVLGIGPDGHFASIFPGEDPLWKSKVATANTQTKHFAVRDRLTMTPSFLQKSKKIILLLRGESKKGVFEKMRHTNNFDPLFPASFWAQQQNVLLLYSSE